MHRLCCPSVSGSDLELLKALLEKIALSPPIRTVSVLTPLAESVTRWLFEWMNLIEGHEPPGLGRQGYLEPSPPIILAGQIYEGCCETMTIVMLQLSHFCSNSPTHTILEFIPPSASPHFLLCRIKGRI